MEFFLVRIFSVFSLNTEKYGTEKTPIGHFSRRLKVTEVIRDKKKKRTVTDAVDMGQSIQE